MTPVQYLGQEKYIQLKQNVFKMGFHLIPSSLSLQVEFPFYIKFGMSPSFYIFYIFVFSNLYGLCVLYANWTKTRFISSIKCKHILVEFCFNWMHFFCPMYCTDIIWDWSIYIFDSNITYTIQELVNLKSLKKMIEDWI